MQLGKTPAFASFVGFLLLSAPAHAALPTVDQCLDASERGQRLESEGKLSSAREQFAVCASDACPPPVRVSCTRSAEQVVERMPSVVVVVRDEGELDVKDAVVTFDDARREPIDGRPIALDPGPHSLRITAPDREPVERAVVVVVGEKDRVVRVQLPVAKAVATLPPRPVDDPARSVPVLAFVLGGISVASLGASIGLGLDARSDRDDLRDAPCAVSRTCAADDEASVKRRLVVADVALGVAVVAGVAAIWVWLSAPSGKTTSAASSWTTF